MGRQTDAMFNSCLNAFKDQEMLNIAVELYADYLSSKFRTAELRYLIEKYKRNNDSSANGYDDVVNSYNNLINNSITMTNMKLLCLTSSPTSVLSYYGITTIEGYGHVLEKKGHIYDLKIVEKAIFGSVDPITGYFLKDFCSVRKFDSPILEGIKFRVSKTGFTLYRVGRKTVQFVWDMTKGLFNLFMDLLNWLFGIAKDVYEWFIGLFGSDNSQKNVINSKGDNHEAR